MDQKRRSSVFAFPVLIITGSVVVLNNHLLHLCFNNGKKALILWGLKPFLLADIAAAVFSVLLTKQRLIYAAFR